MSRVGAILLCFSIAGCVTAAAKERVVEPGATVTLAPGETAALKSTEMRVRFVTVTEDSRCPRDTTCIWAGEVKVRFEIRASAREKSQVEIPEGESTVAGGYRVTLVHVDPPPVSTTKIAPQDYRATAKIDLD